VPDLLLELFSEEIPARMQGRAAEDLRRLVTDALVEGGLTYEGAKAFATPRRLALQVSGVSARSPDLREERKGPRLGAPEAAIQGFLKAAGLSSIDQTTVQADPKKGEFYVALVHKPGRDAGSIVAEALPSVVRNFPWPKSMRWGEAGPGSLRWVRPLHSILCTFGPETEEPEVIAFEVDGLASGDVTRGHRFMGPREPIRVKRFDDYVSKLEAARVVLDPERRKAMIRQDAQSLAMAAGLDLVEDEALLEEVAGLVEWPVVLMGSFDEAFLDLPAEVIRTTIRANQKCFVLGRGGRLANRFVLVSNLEAKDGGAAIVAGNERVVRARLSDARFFWEQDLKVPLEERLERLNNITFHEKLGTQRQRVERIERLARELAPLVGADPQKAARAARLAKADLVTEMVGEFPELQGLMGRYYAEAQGEDPSVARAVEEHYKPVGPGDRVPSDPVSVAVALADKLDTLVGFWAIDEKPTGSKDPYALRRAALGTIRLILGNELRLPLLFQIWEFAGSWIIDLADVPVQLRGEVSLKSVSRFEDFAGQLKERLGATQGARALAMIGRLGVNEGNLLAFFADRLKVQLREQGARHDLVDAVFALGGQDDLLLIVRRVEALGRFLDTEDGRNLLAGVKRAQNILRIEEKKEGRAFEGAPDPALFDAAEEKALGEAIEAAKAEASAAVEQEDFGAAMSALAQLRPAVDAFFDGVTVNAEDAALRENRLKLLNEIRQATLAVADFSKIAS